MAEVTRRAFVQTGVLAGLSLALAAAWAAQASRKADAAAASAGARGASGTRDVAASSAGEGGARKVLVAYFSAQGHTRRVAELVADELGADLFEITPAEPYVEANGDLDWTDAGSRVSREHDDAALQDIPLAQPAPEGFDAYDAVLVGNPLWWGGAAWPVRRFVMDHDFTGKRVVPFCTSMSSALGTAAQDLAALCGTGGWQEGMRFSSTVEEDEVRSWAGSL